MARTVSKLFLKEANKNNFKAGKKKNQSIENCLETTDCFWL